MTAPRRTARRILAGSAGLVLYTYLGYPAVVAAWHRLRPRELARLTELPRISLVVAAYNEEDAIAARVRNLRELDYPSERLEVVVVADGSTDRTAELARQQGVRVLHRPERAGKAAAIDRGVAATDGDILVFSDANNRYERSTLTELVMPFADTSVGVVTGAKRITDDSGRALDQTEGAYWRYESAIKRWETSAGSVTGVAGEILAMRREAYTPLAKGTVNDDFTLAIRAALDGWRIHYAPNAVSLEPASATLEDEATRRARIVAGRYQSLVALLPALVRTRPLLAWQVISHKALRPVVPFAMVSAAASSVVLLRSGRWTDRLVCLTQAAFYGLAAVGALLTRKGRQPMVAYVPYYFCRVNVAAVQGVAQLFSGRDISLWERVARAGGSD
jgi:poly-beta-1,6-N-acetyl-D-glucosamine synthase